MMPLPDDDMSLREIARTLADFRQEFRSQLGLLMRTDVYRAEQAVLTNRLAQLEKDHENEEADRRTTRKLALGAVLTCIGTVIAALLLVALK
jgi:uncharacterized protein YgfB (UPF0149 family)